MNFFKKKLDRHHSQTTHAAKLHCIAAKQQRVAEKVLSLLIVSKG